MSRELEALQDLSKLVFIYGGVQQYQIIENSLKALEIIKSADFSLEFDESQNEWFLYISNEEQCILVAKGTGIKTYDLLKEVLS